MMRYWLSVIVGMVVVAVLVWFVPGAAETVENLVLTVLGTLMGY